MNQQKRDYFLTLINQAMNEIKGGVAVSSDKPNESEKLAIMDTWLTLATVEDFSEDDFLDVENHAQLANFVHQLRNYAAMGAERRDLAIQNVREIYELVKNRIT